MTPIDLLLVNSPSRIGVYGKLTELAALEPPVWAGLIARYCLNKGFSVQILDAEAEGLTVEEAADCIWRAQPRLAAFCIYGQQPSASTQCLPAASAVVRSLRACISHPGTERIATLALGTHPSALPARTLREEPFDFVCQGEGPYTIHDVLNVLKGVPGPRLGTIPSLWSKYCPWQGPTEANIEQLDEELPNQALELLDMKRYRAHNWHLWAGRTRAGGYASVQTSLGCVFRCAFCCIQAPFGDTSPRMRYWSPANVAAQIAKLVNEYGITNLKIADEMFCLNRQHVRQICNHLIDMGLGDRLNIWAYARVDTVKDDEMLALMRSAGFRWLGIGVESGSKHVRDGVEKGRFGNEQIIEAVQRVRKHDIAVAANYIFGLPDDTQESMRETFDLACYLNTEWANFYCAMAYPGSALHRQAQANGWRLPEDPGGPGWIGYSQHAYETLPLPTETLTAAEVLSFRDGAFLQYFWRADYLALIERRFGKAALESVRKMLSYGRPRRKLHGDAAATAADGYNRSVT